MRESTLGCLILVACSAHDYQNPCPTQGVYVVDVALNGGPLIVGGYPPLSSAGVGACLGTDAGSCQPPTRQLTVTLLGSTSPASDPSRRLAASWGEASAFGGMCEATIASSGAGSSDSSLPASSSCDLLLQRCVGADFAEIGLRIATSGPYANLIQASVSAAACCWEGTATTE
jgi:hypothetical protein